MVVIDCRDIGTQGPLSVVRGTRMALGAYWQNVANRVVRQSPVAFPDPAG